MELFGGTLTALVVPALVAGIVAEWRARVSEMRTASRDAQLRRLTETRQLYLSNFEWLVDQRQKGWRDAVSGPMFEHTYGDINLVGDQEVVQQIAHFVHRVLLVRDAEPMNADEESEYLTLNRSVLQALDAQEQLAIRYHRLDLASWERADARAKEHLA